MTWLASPFYLARIVWSNTNIMSTFFITYLISWSICFLFALAILCIKFEAFDLSNKNYWLLLFQPWKVITFLIATMGLTLIAPYTGDPSWDYYDALFMAILTYITAPWTIGLLYKIMHRQRPIWQAYIAICIWLFSSSWSYDLYLLVRDGYYPHTWFSNIFASSILYISAGLLWSLEYIPSKGVIFSFMENNYPYLYSPTPFKKVVLFALPFMLMASIAILYFII